MLKTAIASVLLVLTTCLSQAVPVVGVTVKTNATAFAAPPAIDPISKTVDFSNLTGFTLADLTDVTSVGWITNGAIPPGLVVIDYALNGNFQLSQFGFWNLDRGNNDFGFQNVLIESSPDDVVYTPLTGGSFLAGVHTFTESPANSNNPAELVTFDQVIASSFRFTVLSNFDGSFPNVGYNTIMFDGLAVAAAPELNPAAANLPLCFLSLLMLAGVTRRKSALQA